MTGAGAGAVLAVGVAACTVGELQYLLSDVRRFFGTPLLEVGLSVNQLARLTGWKHDSIDHWMDSGLLESFPIVLRGHARSSSSTWTMWSSWTGVLRSISTVFMSWRPTSADS